MATLCRMLAHRHAEALDDHRGFGHVTVSLNFGVSRQLSCQKVQDPRRVFEKELNRQLNLVGLAGMKLVMTLEVTSHGFGTQSRVHAHGAVETVGLTDDQISAFQAALKKAASIAVGAIGGDRQLVMKPMTSASGWMDCTSCRMPISASIRLICRPAPAAPSRCARSLAAGSGSGCVSATDVDPVGRAISYEVDKTA